MKKRRERGQSLILVAFGIFTLMAFVGLGVDLGLVYVERVRAQRAADAAALAAAAELPLETAAQLRALEYLAENDYDCGLVPTTDITRACTDPNVRFELNVGTPEQFIFGPSADAAERIIRINTAAPEYRDMGRIHVEVTQKAPIFFMRLLGFDTIPVTGAATAENIKNLDVVLVFDKSGSMEFDTLCYGCWTPNSSKEYPDGNFWPLPWGGPPDGPPTHCSGNSPYVYSGKYYIVIEAEEYSWLSNPYNRAGQHLGYTYWVLGRNGYPSPSYLGNARALGRDSRGAYLAYTPGRSYKSDGGGVPCTWDDINNPDPILGRVCRREQDIYELGGPFTAPRVDYDFTVPTSGSWQIWIRAQGGDRTGSTGDYVFWGLSSSDGTYNDTVLGRADGFGNRGTGYWNGADPYKWRWGRLGRGRNNSLPYYLNLQAGVQYTLHFWGGAPGFDIDRIVITNNTGSTLPSRVQTTTHLDNNRTRWACDPCDARFGGYPGGSGYSGPPNCNSGPQPYRYLDDIYDDEQPIRGAVEAAKAFVRRLDPEFDQIGYVYYSSSASIRSELQCRKQAQKTGGTCDQNVIENTIIRALEDTHAGGATNIAHGIKQGIAVLSHQPPHNGRPGAAHIIILLTDGRANTYSYLGSDVPACYQSDYWPHNTGSSSLDRAADCTVYFALKARNNGIVIYTITLGQGADFELMNYVASVTGGIYRHAPTVEQLGPIFDELYERIFLRLVE